ncbi:restriction endonuclease [Arthrobacter globiformis]|uniref:restriction endonuclease n=1 Tax=Arthrobacter globiformis TaxID=1665 RepID=UPI002790EA8E|nr:DEAD/DEAH box helicase family protein [Arthrobacter globiformis]MDQ0617369.1 type III restriction enzyme [Arthrobacter globiformis]
MKLQFDATQPYQRAAVDAVVDLFAGQPLAQSAFETSFVEEGALLTETGIGNRLAISDDQILQNLRLVQGREENFVPQDARDRQLISNNFTVEMETGTGKTYVYLRTIRRLHELYGWRKFIIVVPSVAIREGVKQSIEGMAEHFAEVFERQSMDAWVYDSKDINKVRSFNRDSDLKVMIMTLASFNKAGNVLFKDIEGLGQGIDLIAGTRPIVILDEPQKMESKKSKDALAQLNPLFTLRYSATHKEHYHQIYKLDPVRAYDLGLVKQIMVRSVVQEQNLNATSIKVKKILATKTKVTADVEIFAITNGKIGKKTVKLDRTGQSLYELSGGLSQYASWVMEDIKPDIGEVIFANDKIVREGEDLGVDRDALMQAQVHATVEKHLQHEEYLRKKLNAPGERVKVLSVIFIDKVAHYAGPDSSQPKIRRWFEQAYAELSVQERFAKLNLPDVDAVHSGYFAKDRSSVAKDTSGTTADDQAIYDEIMRDKTLLLNLDNPRRFIFSHSALREGWDNPNVFQICTLNESVSADRKRQEIGRGLRLPVNESGVRCFDKAVNKVTVIANEHYDDFAAALQSEIEEETGVKFDGGRIRNERDQVSVTLDPGFRHNQYFKELWDRIKPRTRYEVTIDSDKLLADVVQRLTEAADIAAPKFVIADASLAIKRGTEQAAGGVKAQLAGALHEVDTVQAKVRIPDVLGYLQRETGLTRGTLAKIVKASGRTAQLGINPQGVLDLLARTINESKRALMVEGIVYHRIEDHDDSEWQLDIVTDAEGPVDRKYLVEVDGSIFSHVRFDSAVEEQFARDLAGRLADGDTDGDIRMFMKLPPRFKVPTPLGGYNPDWAILKIDVQDGRETDVTMVVETKSTHEIEKLRDEEKRKIACGRAHFGAIEVLYEGPVVSASEI